MIATVPATLDALVADHGALITWAIRRSLPKWLRYTAQDLDDIRQLVFVAIIERDVLARVNAERGRFTTLLERVAHNVTLDWVEQHQRRVHRFPPLKPGQIPTGDHGSCIEACEFLDILERHVRALPRVHAALQAARQEETLQSGTLAAVLGWDSSTVRRYVRQLKAAAQALQKDHHGCAGALRAVRQHRRRAAHPRGSRVDRPVGAGEGARAAGL